MTIRRRTSGGDRRRGRAAPWSGGVSRRRRRRRRAMTFIEIMVVVVILGALIAVTAARMKGTSQRAALLGSTREIVAGCNVARQAAISTQRDVWLKFDINRDRWRIDLNVSEDEEDRHARYDKDARYDLEMTHTLPPKISFISVTTSAAALEDEDKQQYPLIIFHPDGTATQASVLLESERGRKMTVQVSAATGRPEAYVGEPKDFADKLKALGVDPGAFGSPQEVASGPFDPNDPDAARRYRDNTGQGDYIKGVLDRLMGSRGYGSETRYGR